jgi:hypothetical protein
MTRATTVGGIARDPRKYACPDCGGPKHKEAKQCRACYRASGSGQTNVNSGVYSDDTVYNIGRREAIITLERDGKTRSLVGYGADTAEQIADARAHLPGDGWTVVCRSTPTTILADLRVGEMGERDLASRVHRNRVVSEL